MTESKRSPGGARATDGGQATSGDASDGSTNPGAGFAAGGGNGFDGGLFAATYGQTVLEMQREWLSGMGAMQRDCLDFLGQRMRKDMEIARRIAECRDVQAAMELQSAFVETTREDYVSEAQKLLEMSRTMTESCVGRLAQVPGRGTRGSSSS